MKKRSVGSLIFLSLVLLVLYLPIVIVVLYSFNDNPARIPLAFTGFTTRWYDRLFTGRNNYGDALLLSLNVAFWSVLISCIIGTLGAIGMAQRTLKTGGKWLDTAMESIATLPIMIPEIILGLAFLVLFNAAGLEGNVLRLVLAHTTFCIPYIFLTVKSRLVGMDVALFDAARDLGASPRQVMLDITLPLCKPMIVYQVITSFMGPWMDFILAKVIVRAEAEYYTVSIGLYKMLEMEFVNNWFTRFCAGAVVVAIPISILFMITQKFYQEAMAGGVKG